MKPYLITIIIFTSVLTGLLIGYVVFPCPNPNSCCVVTSSSSDTVNTVNLSHRDSSRVWVANYKAIWGKIVKKDAALKDSLPLYFTLKSQDVLNAMGIDESWKCLTKLRYFRLTLGFDSVNKNMKAFIQPVINVNLGSKSPFPAGTALFFNGNGEIVDSVGQRLDSLNTSCYLLRMKAKKQNLRQYQIKAVFT